MCLNRVWKHSVRIEHGLGFERFIGLIYPAPTILTFTDLIFTTIPIISLDISFLADFGYLNLVAISLTTPFSIAFPGDISFPKSFILRPASSD